MPLGGQARLLFEAAYALLQFRQQHAMADGGGVIFHHRAPQPADLVAEAFLLILELLFDIREV